MRFNETRPLRNFPPRMEQELAELAKGIQRIRMLWCIHQWVRIRGRQTFRESQHCYLLGFVHFSSKMSKKNVRFTEVVNEKGESSF